MKGSSKDRVQVPLTRQAFQVSRRDLLRGSVGIATLLAVPDFFPMTVVRAASTHLASAVIPHFFLYGISTPSARPGPSFQVGMVPFLDTAPYAKPTTVATQLVTLPIKSPDHQFLALVSLTDELSTPAVIISIIKSSSGTIVQRGRLPLPGLPSGALVLISPTFSSDSATVALVVSITVPTNSGTINKVHPITQQSIVVSTATWTSHHMLAYFHRISNSFTGPYDLSDAPSLARVTVQANDRDLFLWTMREPAAVRRTKAHPVPPPIPELAVFPLGAGTARFSVPAPGPWPVNGEPVAVLPSGDVVRLVYGRYLQVYSANTGEMRQQPVPGFGSNDIPARSGAVTLQVRADGNLFITDPAVGIALVLDPIDSLRLISKVRYAPPALPGGTPTSKAVLSADGRTLYALGSKSTGGINAYNVGTGAHFASTPPGRHFAAVYQLASGAVLAISQGKPRLTFFTPSLETIMATDTALNVTAVF